MEMLIHVCCGPCFIAPSRHLREAGHQLTGFWYNPNIHPFTEYRKRKETLQLFAEQEGIPILYKDEYNLEAFLEMAVNNPTNRCAGCYQERLFWTAKTAKEHGFKTYSSTLLYSRYQNHELIKAEGERWAKEFDLEFFYEDFRIWWQEGIDLSKDAGMYRQPYCGCIYSEKERYWKPGKK